MSLFGMSPVSTVNKRNLKGRGVLPSFYENCQDTNPFARDFTGNLLDYVRPRKQQLQHDC